MTSFVRSVGSLGLAWRAMDGREREMRLRGHRKNKRKSKEWRTRLDRPNCA